MSIQTRRRGDRETVIALHGEVDYATALDLRATISATLNAGAVDRIVVDLAGVTFLDSTGVGTLVVATRICADHLVEFRVCDPNPFIARLLTVMGVAEMLGIPAAPGLPPRTLRRRILSPASRVA
nr:STAS domain-containing protein [Planosporangium flavigriseum]